ncbi:sugar phosphate isomerase/epimerase family protein [Paenibacillus sp. MBLB4367]|uniref:sugar phosphate isomerase/epimerase family protein n=1 Tax=Paenibacillus sp. MBLB4367 TaxID=3384767 RepID=UPI00390813FD
MKFAVFTVMLPDLTPEQALPALRNAGYDGVEWRVTNVDPSKAGETPSFWGNNLCSVDTASSDEALDRLNASVRQIGLETPNLACYLQCGDLAGVERGMQIAKRLGAPSIRVGVPGYNRSKTYQALYAEARSYLEGVQELSRQYGIQGLIEIHMNNIATSASLAHRLVDGFDPKHIGVIYDPGNMVYEGFEQYRMGLELLGPYLAHVHVKNAWWVKNEQPDQPVWRADSCPVHEGVANWKQIIGDLKAVGYDGWLSFEDFSKSGTSEQLLERNIAYIKSLL